MNLRRSSGSTSRAHVLGRDDGALDDEHVEAGVERDLVVLLHALRRERRGGEHAAVLDLLDALRDEFGLDGLLVDLLHRARRRVVGERRDTVELLVGVLVAGLDALEIEYGEAAELAHGDGEGGIDHAVHRRGQARQWLRVRAEPPGDVDILGVAGAATGHDGDVVESVGPAALLAAADLYFHAVLLTGARYGVNKRPGHGRTGVSELSAVLLCELAVCGGNVARLYQRCSRESTRAAGAPPSGTPRTARGGAPTSVRRRILLPRDGPVEDRCIAWLPPRARGRRHRVPGRPRGRRCFSGRREPGAYVAGASGGHADRLARPLEARQGDERWV